MNVKRPFWVRVKGFVRHLDKYNVWRALALALLYFGLMLLWKTRAMR